MRELTQANGLEIFSTISPLGSNTTALNFRCVLNNCLSIVLANDSSSAMYPTLFPCGSRIAYLLDSSNPYAIKRCQISTWMWSTASTTGITNEKYVQHLNLSRDDKSGISQDACSWVVRPYRGIPWDWNTNILSAGRFHTRATTFVRLPFSGSGGSRGPTVVQHCEGLS
jgi:hypothetical protein